MPSKQEQNVRNLRQPREFSQIVGENKWLAEVRRQLEVLISLTYLIIYYQDRKGLKIP